MEELRFDWHQTMDQPHTLGIYKEIQAVNSNLMDLGKDYRSTYETYQIINVGSVSLKAKEVVYL